MRKLNLIDKNSDILGLGDIPLTHLNAIKQNAIKQNLEYSIDNQYLWDLFLKQNKKCVLSGVPLKFTDHTRTSEFRCETTASLDRIDSNVGYVVGNVRWVHKDINRIRWAFDDETFLEWCRKCVLNEQTAYERPSWDEYFITMAFHVSKRSEDNDTKHGAILVDDKTHHIISTGYNALFRGIDKTQINLQRPAKYPWMIHAEENCIMNSNINPLNLSNGSTLYVTGKPCNNCLQRIINFGISSVCYAKRQGTALETDETNAMFEKILSLSKIKIRTMEISNKWIKSVYYN